MIFRNYKKENEFLKSQVKHYEDVLLDLYEKTKELDIYADFSKIDKNNGVYYVLKENTRKQDVLHAIRRTQAITKFAIRHLLEEKEK